MDREVSDSQVLLTQQDLLVELSNGLLVFNSDYLIRRIPELNQLIPEQLVIENQAGVLRDFGHGVYLLMPSDSFDGTVEFRCVVAGVPITACCDFYPSGKGEVLCVERTHLLDALPNHLGCFSILADNSLLLTHKQLWALLGLSQSQAQGFKIHKVTVAGDEYQAKLSRDFCLLCRHHPVYTSLTSPLPKMVNIQIELLNCVTKQLYHHTLPLDLSLFHHIFVTPIATRHQTQPKYLSQSDLLRSAGELSSPILFIDSVYSVENDEFLVATENGSFKLPTDRDPHFIYSISDAIDIVALGVVMPSLSSVEHNNPSLAVKKWCDIKVNKQDLLASAVVDNTDRLNSVSYQHCDWVDVVTESGDELTLNAQSSSHGLGKLSLSASEDRVSEGYLSFELVFMPNLVFHRCVQERNEHQWQISTKEIENLIAKRTKKRIQHLDINCNTACVTMSDAETCALWTTEWLSQVRLNLTLTFEDGSLGFSSINI